MLVDEAKITIKAGNGGDGTVSFRREKYVPKGGPDGGDGGNGGDILIESSSQRDTLSDFLRAKKFEAENGERGGSNNKHGKSGKNLYLTVPTGTQILNKFSKVIIDLDKEKTIYVAAKGGRGGLGNTHFKSPTNRAPRQFLKGKPGEEKGLKLVLKLIADVGIIGLPNAGKSTLISTISRAKPKIADYPFTTIEPVLGVANFKNKNITFCDIPGLIEGASTGKGLGHKFLRHLERTKILLHLIDATNARPAENYQIIRDELKKFSPELIKKPEIIVLTKTDAVKALPKNFKYDLAISAATGKEIPQLLQKIAEKLNSF